MDGLPPSAPKPEFSRLSSEPWDALIVGTGMGGATLGYALARAGWRVLFLEQGRSHLNAPAALRGDYAERFFPRAEAAQPKHQAILARAGRWSGEVGDASRGSMARFIPFLGCGTGGSSTLYGMALERLFPCDFQPGPPEEHHGRETAQTAAWPIAYRELLPYYQAAERLFRPCGAYDPMRGEAPDGTKRAPPALNPAHEPLLAHLLGQGLHPYRLPVGCEYNKGDDRCQGFIDRAGVKNDAAQICLRPALASGNAELLDECQVLRLDASRTRVTSVACLCQGQRFSLRAKMVVLAAGALATPCLLQRSHSRLWPQGLANASGLVGRNLMRHFLDLYLLKGPAGAPIPGNLKELAFNDWYRDEYGKGGTVQSFGALPPASMLVAELEDEWRAGGRRWPARLLRLGRPVVEWILARQLARRLVLASILEDFSRRENRVCLGGPGEAPMVIEYRLQGADQARIEHFRVRMRKLLAPFDAILVKQAEQNRHLAHACGTCRFGDDPQTSVLNRHNRAHGLDNLYVVDASFFPSSGGTNPGLTIAANALRVAEHLHERAGHAPSSSARDRCASKVAADVFKGQGEHAMA